MISIQLTYLSNQSQLRKKRSKKMIHVNYMETL